MQQEARFSIFPVESRPYGFTYGEWSAKWWQWLLAIPKSSNPAYDSSGANADMNQSNSDVFFLCQTCERADSFPNRTAAIPTGRAIFMPIISWVSFPDSDMENDEELLATARKRIDAVADLEVTINGLTIKEELVKYRTQSPFFECLLPEDNVFGLSAGHKRAVSDGYWLFIKPLQKISKLSTLGSCSSGVTKIGVNYNIRDV